jgi:hypothetical protein
MKNEQEWKKAQRLCRLSNEDTRMARELGMGPRGLMKNIPNPKQRWKAPVKVWIRELNEKKFGREAQAPPSPLPRTASTPTDTPEDLLESELTDVFDDYGPPTSDETAEEAERMLQRRQDFRLAADYVAEALAEFEVVEKIVLFGSVVPPLEWEVPRFSKFRRASQPLYHECKDVDLAVWLTDLGDLDALRKARARALALMLEEQGIGVVHHLVSILISPARIPTRWCPSRLLSSGSSRDRPRVLPRRNRPGIHALRICRWNLSCLRRWSTTS